MWKKIEKNVKELKDRNDKNVKLFLYKIYKNLDGKAESSCLIWQKVIYYLKCYLKRGKEERQLFLIVILYDHKSVLRFGIIRGTVSYTEKKKIRMW